MEELQNQNDELRREVEKLQEKYHELIFATYVKSNPISTIEDVKRIVLESLRSTTENTALPPSSSELPQNHWNEKENEYKNQIRKLEEQVSIGNEQLLETISNLKEKELEYLEKLKQQDLFLEESSKVIELLRSKENQSEQTNMQLPIDNQDIEFLAKQIEELKAKESSYLSIIADLQQQLSEIPSTKENNSILEEKEEQIKKLLAIQEQLGLEDEKRKEELLHNKQELEYKLNYIAKVEKSFAELELRLSDSISVIEDLKRKNKEYEDEISLLKFREEATSSETLMKQLSELIQEREKMQIDILQLKLKLDTSLREFESKEVQYNYRIKELSESIQQLPAAPSQNPQELSQFLTNLDSSENKNLDQIRKLKEEMEELTKSLQSKELFIFELQQKIKTLEERDTSQQISLKEFEKEIENLNSLLESSNNEFQARSREFQKLNEELRDDLSNSKSIIIQREKVIEELREELKEQQIAIDQLQQNLETALAQTDQLKISNQELEFNLQAKSELTEALTKLNQEPSNDQMYLEELRTAHSKIKELESTLAQAQSDLQDQRLESSITIKRFEKELAALAEEAKLNISLDTESKEIKAQLEQKESLIEEKERMISELKEKQNEDQNTIDQLTNQMKMKVKVLQKLKEDHEEIKNLNQEYLTNAKEMEQQLETLKKEKDEALEQLSKYTEEMDSIKSKIDKLVKEKESSDNRYDELKKRVSNEMQSLIDEKDYLSQEKGSINEKLLEQQKLYRTLQYQFDTARESYDRELEELRKEKENLSKSLLEKSNHNEKAFEIKSPSKPIRSDNTVEIIPEIKSPLQSETSFKENTKSPAKLVSSKKATAPSTPKSDVSVEEERPKKRISLKKNEESPKENIPPSPATNLIQQSPMDTSKITSENANIEEPPEQNTGTPHSDSQSKKVVVCFSGFKEDEKAEYSSTMRAELIDQVTKLGGEVKYDAGFDKSITHVITPPKCRTMKTLAASLTKRWLVSPDWVKASFKEGKFISEEDFGVKHKKSVFKGVTFFVSEGFKKENQQSDKSEKMKNFHLLLEQLGGGKIINDPNEANYVLVASHAEDKKKYENGVTWNKFIEMIPSFEEVEKKVRFEGGENDAKPPAKRKSTSEETKTLETEPEPTTKKAKKDQVKEKNEVKPAEKEKNTTKVDKKKKEKKKASPEPTSAPEKRKVKKEPEVEAIEKPQEKKPATKKRNLSIPKK